MRRQVARAALALYPQAWRDRYGDEAGALLDEQPPSAAAAIDLLRGALDAHLHPRGLRPTVGDQMRNTVSSALFCWIAFVFAGAGFAKLTEDAPFSRAADADALIGGARAAVVAFALLAGAAVLAGGARLVESILRQALGSGNRRLLRPVIGTTLGLAPFALVTGAGVLISHASATSSSMVKVVFFSAWVASAAITAVACGIGARVVIHRAELPNRSLRAGVRGAPVVALSMAAIAAAAAIYLTALLIQTPSLAALNNTPFDLATFLCLAIDLAVMATAAVLAAITSARGVRALRAATD